MTKEKLQLGILKFFSFFLLGIILIFTAYAVTVVSQAKTYTENIVLKDLKNKKWRLYESDPRKLLSLPKYLTEKRVKELITIQDPNFLLHNGVDLNTPGAGLTTISQSMVKKLFFTNFTPGFAKIKQTLIAVFVIDNLISKNDQLELFVNSIYMGTKNDKKIYGIFEASEKLYRKKVSELSDDEYLSLIAMLIAPHKFDLKNNIENNKLRVDRIKRVLSGEYIPKSLNDLYYDHT